MKQAFIFWPKVSVNKPTSSEEDKNTQKQEKVVSGATGTKIIDISKWQGNIDFNKVRKEVSFIIARASCGSDKDIKFDEYAKAMNELNIPFGVYCYSYAGTVSKAKDEAQKIVKYASSYKPLFYVIDAEEERLVTETIKAFANELRTQGIKKIGCYVANHRYKEYNYDSIRDLFDFTWIPTYSNTPSSYKCDLWQNTSSGKIDGINGNVDMNVITGDGHDLDWFIGR